MKRVLYQSLLEPCTLFTDPPVFRSILGDDLDGGRQARAVHRAVAQHLLEEPAATETGVLNMRGAGGSGSHAVRQRSVSSR